jgi:hypothetical protein
MINENTIYYIDELNGEKKIYEGDKKNIKIIKKDEGIFMDI